MRDIEEMLKIKCRSARSRETYERIASSIGEFNPQGVRRWWAKLEAKNLSDGSLQLYRAVAQSMLRYFVELGDSEAQEALRWVRQINVPSPQTSTARKTISVQELSRIARVLPERAQLALEVLRLHGLRVSTLLSLEPSNIVHNSRGWWLAFRTKRRRLVELKSTEELCRKLLATPTPWFSWDRHEFWRMLTQASKKAIGRRVIPHDLRRRYITTIYEAEKDLLLAQRMAGHASSRTTERYVVQNVERMDEMLKRL